MLLINCRVEFSLTWNPNCVLWTAAGDSAFTITDAKLHVPIVTLSREDNAKLSKLLSKRFKRPVYWNAYKVIAEKSFDFKIKNRMKIFIRETIDSSCQRMNRLFVLAYEGGANRVTTDSHRRHFLPRVEIKNCNIEIYRKSFYDQPSNN